MVLLRWDGASEMWVAEVPDLPGVGAQGETMEEARQSAADGIETMLDCLRDEGEDLPVPRTYHVTSVNVPIPAPLPG